MNFKLKSLAMLALAGLVFTSCNDDDDNGTPPPAGPTQNIVEIAAANPNYSILAGALGATGLISTLEGPGPFTVFAPDNAAFNALFDELGVPAGTNEERLLAAASALGVDAIRDLLLYHVLSGEILAANVPTKAYVNTQSTAGAGGNNLSLLVERGTGVSLNGGTNVVAADIRATNGVIHGIGAVLGLPDVVDHALNNPADFSELAGALTAANLVETLQNADGEFTVFAPVNAGFEAISDVVAGLTTDQLTTVLTYHVVLGNVRSTDLEAGAVGALNGQEFTVGLGDSVTLLDAAGNTSTVVVVDVQGTNGVVHAISSVLIPEL